MSAALSPDELTREGVRALCKELGVSKAMQFLSQWSRSRQSTPRRDYADVREEEFANLSPEELVERIRAWEKEQAEGE